MKKLMRCSAFLGGGFLAVMMGAVIWLGMNREIVMADAGSTMDVTQVSVFGELPGDGPQENGDAETSAGIFAESTAESERWPRVVVLEVESSEDLSSQEEEALCQIEEKLQALLEAEGIRTYSAAGTSGDAGQKDTLQLIDQTGASLYVGLKFDRDEDGEKFGSYVCYSSLYFRPWFTNGSFADQIEQEMVSAIEGKALGLVEEEDGILRELSIPAVVVCPGYVSHGTEGKLLLKDSYQDRIAEGICGGILQAFEELKV